MLEGGYHFILDIEGCDLRLLNSPHAMLKLCCDLAKLMGARILQRNVHQFKPGGVTAFIIIAESHVSIHTWPESGKAFLDIFTCKELFDADRALDYILGKLGGKRGKATLILRNSLLSRLLFDGRLSVTSLNFDFGRTIFSTRSPFQRIELTYGPMGISLFLDGYWQFVEKYEHIYHETLVHPAMVCAPGIQRVGIAGGGDGLALREVLRHPHLGRVWMYELDAKMLSVAKTHPEMVRLNRGALQHPKACVVAADARQMLNPQAKFDVLMLDFPSISDGTKFSELYSESLYRKAKEALVPQGILVTQVTDFPWNLRQTILNLQKVFPYVLPIDIGFQFSMFNFVMASSVPFRQQRALPAGLKFIKQGTINSLFAPYRVNPKHVISRARKKRQPDYV